MKSTCRHFREDAVKEAAELVRYARDAASSASNGKRKAISCFEMECVHCGEGGNLGEVGLHQHLLDRNHYLAVRIREPYEIYCDVCGDYQYSTLFDSLVGRHRCLPPPEQLPLEGPGGYNPVHHSHLGRGLVMQSSEINSAMSSRNQTALLKMCEEEAVFDAAPNNADNNSKRTKSQKRAPIADPNTHRLYSSCAPDSKKDSAPPALIDRYFLPWRPTRGMCNMGATCFMSSVLQVLLNSHRMRKALQRFLPFNANGVLDGPGSLCSITLNGCKGDISDGPHETTSDAAALVEDERNSINHPVVLPVPQNTEGCIACETRNLVVASLAGPPVNYSCAPSALYFSGAVEEKDPDQSGSHAGDSNKCSQKNIDREFSFDELCYMHARTRLSISKFGNTSSGSKSSAKQKADLFPALIPSNLLYSVWRHANYMAGYEQQDAHEFLIAYLDGLETHIKSHHSHTFTVSSKIIKRESSGALGTKSRESSSDANKVDSFVSLDSVNRNGSSSTKMPSLMRSIFGGVLRSEVRCVDCGNTSCTDDPFLDISLSLDLQHSSSSTPKKTSSDGLHLLDCLNEFTCQELLNEHVYCTKCGTNKASVKTFSIENTPEILVIHLKRFDSVSQRKVHTKVKFDLTDLDLSPYLSAANQNSAKGGLGREIDPKVTKKSVLEGSPSFKYNLHGVVTHKGSLNSGHYVSYVLAGTEPDTNGYQWNQWQRCDDETVTRIDPKAVEEVEAYLLFYEKAS